MVKDNAIINKLSFERKTTHLLVISSLITRKAASTIV